MFGFNVFDDFLKTLPDIGQVVKTN